LIPASFVSFRLSEIVRESSVGPLDRSLGFVFGLARGLLVVGMGFVVFSSLAIDPKNYPDWIREARLLPVVKGTAEVILSFRSPKHKIAGTETATADTKEPSEETAHADNASTKPAPRQKPAAGSNTGSHEDGGGEKRPSYSAGDRHALDELIKSTSKE
jgi:membrane protein required for colicin V production